jgi:hypothetical protein
MVTFMPLSLYTRGKSPRYPFDRKVDGTKSDMLNAEFDFNRVYNSILDGMYEGI